jgi:hypothetical protein
MAIHKDLIRSYVYQHFVDRQRAPDAQEIAAALNISRGDVLETMRRLAADRLLVLDSQRTGVLMAEPFSAVATRFTVHSGESTWWANCAWDALGVAAALHADVEIRSACPDCNHPLSLSVTAGKVAGDPAVIHLAVPAEHWWDDIVFT